MVDIEGPKRLIELFTRRNRNKLNAAKTVGQSYIMPLSPPKKTESVPVYKSLIESPETRVNSLNIDKLHVLKIMNRESESPVLQKDRLFSKYSPLPSIKQERPPEKPRPLVREKTFKVLDPVYVKGPQDEKRIKAPKVAAKQELPKIEEKSPRPARAARTAGRSRSRVSSRTSEVKLAAPKKTKTLSGETEVSELKKIREGYQNRGFCPNRIEDDGPAKTVFWFPM